MSWIRIAADLLRDAMSAEETREQPQPPPVAPASLDEVAALVNRHRAEIDKSFESVAQMFAAQNARHVQAIQTQRRWNYALAAGFVIAAILAAISYFRT